MKTRRKTRPLKSRRLVRSTLFRFGWTYLRGVLVIAVVVFLVRLVAQSSADVADWLGLSPALSDSVVWTAVMVAAVIAAPWAIGHLTGFLVPRFQRHRGVQALMRWERNLAKEFTPDAAAGYQVALFNWPSREVRSIGVVAATFEDPDSGRELAAVYLPNAPNPAKGSLRVVAVEDLTMTDWALRDMVNYHLSFGSAVPPPTPSDGSEGT